MTDIVVTGAGGEYMESVVVVEWLAKVGDAVKAGDVVVIVETAKAATEIEAPESGMLSEIRAEVGTEIEVGGLLGVIGEGGAKPALAAAVPAAEPPSRGGQGIAPVAAPAKDTGRIVASPLARRLAKSQGVDLAEVRATSPSGRIKVRDVEHALANRSPAPETVAAPKARTVSVAGSLHLNRREGDGIPIVFLHGFGSDSISWRPVLSALRSRNPTICVDLPSHGRSPALPVADVRAIGVVVANALEEAGVNRAHMVGHSLGGATALALAEGGLIDIRSLALIAPAGLGPEIDGAFITGFARATQMQSLEPWLRRLFADESFVTPAFVAATMQTRESPEMRARQSALADLVFPNGTQASDFRQALSRLAMPQKIIWGIQDQVIPWKHALAGPGKAGLHLLPGVGHMAQLEAAGAVSEAIDELVRSAS